MQKSLTMIVGLGIVTAIFMAVMSMFYLQQIPTQEDLNNLEDDIRREHGFYLAAIAPLDLDLIIPSEDSDEERTGLKITCTLRQDLQRGDRRPDFYLNRIADMVLEHPSWRGKIAFVTVVHAGGKGPEITRRPAPTAAETP